MFEYHITSTLLAACLLASTLWNRVGRL